MNINVIGRKCTPRDSFKERAEKKLQKIDRFFDDGATAKVTATAEKSCKIVEITVNTNGMIYRAEERSDDMTEALDKCVDTLIRKIRKNKTKLEKRLRAENFDSFFVDEEPVEEETKFDLVRTKQISVKPQSVEEAILQMNMLGHQFYMFRNDETGAVNVVYKRNDGGYGLIEPTDN